MTAPERQNGPSAAIHLDDIDGIRGCFSGTPVDYRAPCTATEHRACHVARHMSAWNEILVRVRLELSHLPGTSGNLCLSRIAGKHPRPDELVESQTHQAVTLLYWLLKGHHCVSSAHVHLDTLGTHADIASAALEMNTSVKQLKLRFSRSDAPERLTTIMPTFGHLEQLECDCLEDRGSRLLGALSRLLHSTTSLRTLDLSSVWIESDEAALKFFEALKANLSLRELAFRYEARQDAYRAAFKDYLQCTTTLEALKVVASSDSKSSQASILEGLSVNRSVCTFILDFFRIDRRNTALMADVLEENNVLRRLHLGPLTGMGQLDPPNICGRFLEAIIRNETLQELSIPVHIWEPAKWARLFSALASKENPKKLTILTSLWNTELLQHICGALSGSGAEEKVSLGKYYVEGDISVVECKAVSEVCFMSGTENELERGVLQLLPSLNHIRTVSVGVSRSNLTLSSAVADYVRATTSLRVLKLFISSGATPPDVANMGWGVILDALSQNTSVTDLYVSVSNIFSMDEEDLKRLADLVKNSKHIRRGDFSFEMPAETSVFVRRLSVDISTNYALIGILLRTGMEPTREWFTVLDTVRRNSDLVTRAALFLKTSQCDKHSAAALEPVARHPALLQELADLLSVSEAEAAAVVQSRLLAIRDMDDFMRFAGVVKERVACWPRQDGRVQLDELNADCWRHVRGYLALEDVKDPVHLLAAP